MMHDQGLSLPKSCLLLAVTLLLAAATGPVASAQWTMQPITSKASKFNTVHFISNQTGFIGGYQTLMRTTDAGVTWKETTHPNIGDVNAIAFPSTQTGYAVDASGEILKSVDGGTSWTLLTSGTTTKLTGVYFLTDLIGFVIGGDRSAQQHGIVLKTVDGGKKWTSMRNETDMEFYSFWATDASTIYVGGVSGYRGIFLKSVNGGTTWTSYETDTKTFPTSLQFVSADSGFAACAQGGLLKTVNGGSTWTPLSPGYNGTFNALYFSNGMTGYAVAAENGLIFRTSDRGATWKAEYSSTNLNLTAVHGGDSNAFAVGAGSMILRRVASSSTGADVALTAVGERGSNIALAPNPTSGACTIDYTVDRSGPVWLEVYDPIGRRVASLAAGEEREAGAYHAAFTPAESGTYLVRLITSSGTKSERLTVVR